MAFRKRDLTRALAAAKQAGIEIERVEVQKDGNLILVVRDPDNGKPKQIDTWADLK